jgi:hypothetical protein
MKQRGAVAFLKHGPGVSPRSTGRVLTACNPASTGEETPDTLFRVICRSEREADFPFGTEADYLRMTSRGAEKSTRIPSLCYPLYRDMAAAPDRLSGDDVRLALRGGQITVLGEFRSFF